MVVMLMRILTTSLQHVITLKELNLRQKRWLELLKDYDMSVLCHPIKANVAAYALSHITMGSVFHINESKKYLVKYVHRLSISGVILEESPNFDFMVHQNSESLLVVDVNSKQHLYQPLMDLQELVLGKINKSLSLGGMVS